MASEEEKDRVSMEKFGCKFSELKDPQDRMSVGGTIGGNMRKPQMTTKSKAAGQEEGGRQGTAQQDEQQEGGEEGEGDLLGVDEEDVVEQ